MTTPSPSGTAVEPRADAASDGAEDTTSPDGSPADTEATLPLDVAFELLSNERRRRVMRYLLEEGETTLGELAERIAAIENEKPEEALSSTERKRVYICLYQCHLPKLDDADVVAFDEHRKSVEPGTAISRVTDYLPAEDGPIENPRRDPTPVLALVGVVGGLLVAQHLLVAGAWPSGFLVVGLIVSVVAVSLRWTGMEHP